MSKLQFYVRQCAWSDGKPTKFQAFVRHNGKSILGTPMKNRNKAIERLSEELSDWHTFAAEAERLACQEDTTFNDYDQ